MASEESVEFPPLLFPPVRPMVQRSLHITLSICCIVVGLATMTSCSANNIGERNFQDLLPAPSGPPVVILIGKEGETSPQDCILIGSDWTKDGQIVRRKLGMPLDRPDPVNASFSNSVTIRIATESAPHELEIRQFHNLRDDGTYEGLAVSIVEWQHPRVFSSHAKDYALLKYNDDVDIPGWEYEFEIPYDVSISYMNVWAVWYENNGADVFSANWTVSARRNLLAD